jgi:hypothetical protein
MRGAWWKPGRESPKASSNARPSGERKLRAREGPKMKRPRGQHPGSQKHPCCLERSQHPATAGANEPGGPPRRARRDRRSPAGRRRGRHGPREGTSRCLVPLKGIQPVAGPAQQVPQVTLVRDTPEPGMARRNESRDAQEIRTRCQRQGTSGQPSGKTSVPGSDEARFGR